MATVTTIHQEMFDAWNARDFTAFRTLFHPEYTYTGGDGKTMTGGPDLAVGIGQMYATACPDATLTLKRSYAAGDVAVAEMVAKGTHGGDLMGVPATGRPVELFVCNVVELRDGLVFAEREYVDTGAMFAQIGVNPPIAAAAH